MKVLVAGAGIAGLGAAIALADRGHDVTVLERRTRGNNEGAGIILWPQACGVLDALGVLASITTQAALLLGLERRSLAGERLQLFDFRNAPPPALLRAHLFDALLAAAEQRGVDLRFGCGAAQVLDAGGRDAPAIVATEDGEHFTADLVIGADGRMNSVVGQAVRGIARVDHGLLSWIGVTDGMAPALDGVAVDFWADGARFGVVPCGAGRAYWAATVRNDLVDETRGWRDTVQALLPDRQGLVRNVLAATAEAGVHRYRLFDLEPDGAWHRGRLVLIGDAAHASLPTTGRGASEALLDAAALAESLPPDADFDGLQAGLARFTTARQAEAHANLRAARELSRRVFG